MEIIDGINRCDGKCKSVEEIQSLLRDSLHPIVFTNMLGTWPASHWSLEEFTNLFGHLATTFKLYHKKKAKSVFRPPDAKKCRSATKSVINYDEKNVVMETDCFYANATFKDFYGWLNGIIDNENMSCELHRYPLEEFWCYADYKYMAELFCDHPEAIKAVDWSAFGFPGRDGHKSTIWVGSDESYTPCHQDTYGTNLVAQLCGTKKWILFSPLDSSHMSATRIPYEESSVFSNVDLTSTAAKSCTVYLNAGEVLYVPKHWWHYVESVTPSISVNTWLEHSGDRNDRLRESLVNLFVYAMKTTEGVPTEKWLNPMQIKPSSFALCLQLVHASLKENLPEESIIGDEEVEDICDVNLLVNCITDNDVLDKIIEVLFRRITLKGKPINPGKS